MTDIVNDYLKSTLVMKEIEGYTYQDARPRIECKDGFSLSVQAGKMLYSIPREDDRHYTHVEVGYPSARPPDSWREYAEDTLGNTRLHGFFINLGDLLGSLRSRYSRGFIRRLHLKKLFKDRSTTTIYPYIPVELVAECINLHGGIND